ncbi:MAG TPA: hypothetical protein VGO62_07740 [Myxococcota bacterium]|jgi:hypothetical protein
MELLPALPVHAIADAGHPLGPAIAAAKPLSTGARRCTSIALALGLPCAAIPLALGHVSAAAVVAAAVLGLVSLTSAHATTVVVHVGGLAVAQRLGRERCVRFRDVERAVLFPSSSGDIVWLQAGADSMAIGAALCTDFPAFVAALSAHIIVDHARC